MAREVTGCPGEPLGEATLVACLMMKTKRATKVAGPSHATEVAGPSFLDPWSEVKIHRGRKLPHWQQDKRTYFVTFHLADSIPQAKLREWAAERAAWLRWNPPPWSEAQQKEYARRFGVNFERWLDAGEGACVLRQLEAAEIVAHALRERAEQHAFIVMPNHVHALFSTKPDEGLGRLLQPWKGASAREINQLFARTGTLWQKDYFDRLIRNDEHFWNCAKYIRNNPVKARLSPGEYLLYESGYVRDALGPIALGPLLGPATLVAPQNPEENIATKVAAPSEATLVAPPNPNEDPATKVAAPSYATKVASLSHG